MKKLTILFFGLFLLLRLSYAQDSTRKAVYPPVRYDKARFFKQKGQDYYMEKWRKSNTTAWILFATGSVGLITGYFVYKNNSNGDDLENWGNDFGGTFSGIITMTVGGLLICGSVPLFISSDHYRKKAMNLSAGLKSEQLPGSPLSGLASKKIPALSLQIHF